MGHRKKVWLVKTKGQRLVMWGMFILLSATGLTLTLFSLDAHNEGGIWEGGLFCGFGLSAFMAALTTKTR